MFVTRFRLVNEDLRVVPLNYQNGNPARSSVDVSLESSAIPYRDRQPLVGSSYSPEGFPTTRLV